MKKYWAALVVLLMWGPIEALPLGNPAQASLFTQGVFTTYQCPSAYCNLFDFFRLEGGFYGDYVFNRNLETRGNLPSFDIQKVQLFTNAGYLGGTLFNRIEVFGTLGASTLNLETPLALLPVTQSIPFVLQSHTHFSWSAGGRALLWCCRNFTLGFEGQYFQFCPRLNWIRYIDDEYIYFNDAKTKYFEWQFGLGLSYEMKMACDAVSCIPYIGVKWARAKWLNDLDPLTLGAATFDLPNMKSSRRWGYAVGVTLATCRMWSMTVEGRFADEKAIHVNGILSF